MAFRTGGVLGFEIFSDGPLFSRPYAAAGCQLLPPHHFQAHWTILEAENCLLGRSDHMATAFDLLLLHPSGRRPCDNLQVSAVFFFFFWSLATHLFLDSCATHVRVGRHSQGTSPPARGRCRACGTAVPISVRPARSWSAECCHEVASHGEVGHHARAPANACHPPRAALLATGPRGASATEAQHVR